MDLYESALALGGIGLLIMAVAGLGAHGHDGSGAHDATGHVHHIGPHPHPHHGHESGHGHAQAHESLLSKTALALLSPRILFAVLVGIGAAGILAGYVTSGLPRAAIALVGGLVFEIALVRPLWNLISRFASNPALTMESAYADEARATSGFDTTGHGIVAIEVDGQIVQCLATLRADDLALGVRVRAGDRLRVEEVDTQRQRCTVSYVGGV